jgi:beta-N-acetylhexosaminidase
MTNAVGSEDIGKLLILSLEESRWNASLERRLRRVRPAGVLLNVARLPDPEQTADLLARIARAVETTPFLCLEEEGGEIDPLQAILPRLPSPRLAAQNGESAVERLGSLIGAGLELLGFNAGFVPRLDLGVSGSEVDSGGQTFSSDAREVTRCGEAFLNGLLRHRVVACAKHFPGLGPAPVEHSAGEIVIGKPMGGLWREDLLPYRHLLRRMPMVLLSHAAYKAYDYDPLQPAAVSERVINGLLRTKLGYGGLCVADLTRPQLASSSEEAGASAVRSVTAGCDLLIVAEESATLDAIQEELRRAIESGKLAMDRAAQAAEKVMQARRRLRAPSATVSKSALDRLAQSYARFGSEITKEPAVRALSDPLRP